MRLTTVQKEAALHNVRETLLHMDTDTLIDINHEYCYDKECMGAVYEGEEGLDQLVDEHLNGSFTGAYHSIDSKHFNIHDSFFVITASATIKSSNDIFDLLKIDSLAKWIVNSVKVDEFGSIECVTDDWDIECAISDSISECEE